METLIENPEVKTFKSNGATPNFTRPVSQVAHVNRPLFELRSTTAARKIDEKWNALNGSPGLPKIPGRNGLVPVSDGFYREYLTGARIYFSDAGVFIVYGSIGQRYTELGGPLSWMGWPISDELDFTEGGRASKFQNGNIYWWPDLGAIELDAVSVRYTGTYCNYETYSDQGSNSDEPYAIIGVIGATEQDAITIRTQIYEDVDSGDSRPDNLELYMGDPNGLSITVTMMEHDESDPDKYKDFIKASVEQASRAAVLGIQKIPHVGGFLAPPADALLKAIAPDITDAINSLLDLDDDVIDTKTFFISARDMIRLTRVPTADKYGINSHLHSPVLSGDEAEYTTYFQISAV